MDFNQNNIASLSLDKKQIEILKIVQNELSQDPSHTLEHIIRVYKNAMLIAETEDEIDFSVLKTAILLHDIARLKEDKDNTGKTDHSILGAEIAEKILTDLEYPKEVIDKIKHCISSHRFRGNIKPKSLEAKILFDADKIDLLGAIGIARTFMIAGKYNQTPYSFHPINQYILENLVDGSIDGRIKDKTKHAPNIEFETKIVNIPKKLFTKKAKAIATEKMKFMKHFFQVLKSEII